MAAGSKSRIAHILQEQEATILADWHNELKSSELRRDNRLKESELREQTSEFLKLISEAAQSNGSDSSTVGWGGVRDFLVGLSRSHATQGFSPTDTTTFVLSFKKPLFKQLRKELAKDAEGLADETWAATQLIDGLGMLTSEAFQKTREELIQRQQEDMLELSTP